jgi:hypothetical protein
MLWVKATLDVDRRRRDVRAGLMPDLFYLLCIVN